MPGGLQVRHRGDGRDRRGARWGVLRRPHDPRLDQGQGRHLRVRAGRRDAGPHGQADQRAARDGLRDHRAAVHPRRERARHPGDARRRAAAPRGRAADPHRALPGHRRLAPGRHEDPARQRQLGAAAVLRHRARAAPVRRGRHPGQGRGAARLAARLRDRRLRPAPATNRPIRPTHDRGPPMRYGHFDTATRRVRHRPPGRPRLVHQLPRHPGLLRGAVAQRRRVLLLPLAAERAGHQVPAQRRPAGPPRALRLPARRRRRRRLVGVVAAGRQTSGRGRGRGWGAVHRGPRHGLLAVRGLLPGDRRHARRSSSPSTTPPRCGTSWSATPATPSGP